MQASGADATSGQSDTLRQEADQQGVPVKTVLLAAHLQALQRLAGGDEVVTGVVMNARPDRPGSTAALGLFLNTLPLRIRPDRPWSELLRALLDAEVQVMRHRYFPLSRLRRMAGDRQPFATVFNFVHYHRYDRLNVAGRCELVSAVSLEDTGIDFAANFGVTPGGEAIGLVATDPECCSIPKAPSRI